MTPGEQRFFIWLKANHPSLYAYFWHLRENSGGVGGYGIQRTGLAAITASPEDIAAANSGGILDSLDKLAQLYYQYQEQQAAVEAQIAAAKAEQIANTAKTAPIDTGFNFGIAPNTAVLAIAGLAALWLFSRKAR